MAYYQAASADSNAMVTDENQEYEVANKGVVSLRWCRHCLWKNADENAMIA